MKLGRNTVLGIVALWILAGLVFAQRPQSPKKSGEIQNVKDVPTITQEAAKATVLVAASSADGREISQGSGFLVSADGKVITNYHVIEGASSAVVKFPNGAFYAVKGVIGIDKQRDIAVLKADGKGFPVIPLGDSELVQVGQEVLAIGSPLSLEATVSTGIISAVRELEDERLKLFQTTAPVSPGSSGGALLNRSGEVIGITSFQKSRGQNLNFAIPINYAKFLLSGTAVRPLSDVTVAQSSPIPETSVAPSSQSSSKTIDGFPTVWTSLTSGKDYKVRVEGDYAYAEWIIPRAYRQYAEAGAFERCEFKKEGDQWRGRCWSLTPMTCTSFLAGNYINWCRFESTETITLFSPIRIEGEGAGPDTTKDFDCGKCRAKRTRVTQFVLIPKQ